MRQGCRGERSRDVSFAPQSHGLKLDRVCLFGHGRRKIRLGVGEVEEVGCSRLLMQEVKGQKAENTLQSALLLPVISLAESAFLFKVSRYASVVLPRDSPTSVCRPAADCHVEEKKHIFVFVFLYTCSPRPCCILMNT